MAELLQGCCLGQGRVSWSHAGVALPESWSRSCEPPRWGPTPFSANSHPEEKGTDLQAPQHAAAKSCVARPGRREARRQLCLAKPGPQEAKCPRLQHACPLRAQPLQQHSLDHGEPLVI